MSADVAEKIMQKQEHDNAIRERNMRFADDQEANACVDEHVKLADALRSMFVSKKKTTLRWTDVLASLKESNRGTFESDQTYKERLQQLV